MYGRKRRNLKLKKKDKKFITETKEHDSSKLINALNFQKGRNKRHRNKIWKTKNIKKEFWND